MFYLMNIIIPRLDLIVLSQNGPRNYLIIDAISF